VAPSAEYKLNVDARGTVAAAVVTMTYARKLKTIASLVHRTWPKQKKIKELK